MDGKTITKHKNNNIKSKNNRKQKKMCKSIEAKRGQQCEKCFFERNAKRKKL